MDTSALPLARHIPSFRPATVSYGQQDTSHHGEKFSPVSPLSGFNVKILPRDQVLDSGREWNDPTTVVRQWPHRPPHEDCYHAGGHPCDASRFHHRASAV